MKRLLFIVIAVVSTSFLFAGEISIGLSGSYERYNQNFSGTYTYEGNEFDSGSGQLLNRGGVEFFIDTTYLQAALGYSTLLYGISGGTGVVNMGTNASKIEETPCHLSLSAYLKYPLEGNRVTFFPMVGGKYLMPLSYVDGDGEDARENLSISEWANLNEIWVKAGMGVDFDLSEKLFVRVTALGGYKFNSKLETQTADWWGIVDSYDSRGYLTLDFEATFGLGLKL